MSRDGECWIPRYVWKKKKKQKKKQRVEEETHFLILKNEALSQMQMPQDLLSKSST